MRNFGKIKAIVFDVGNTLFDVNGNVKISLDAMVHVLRVSGINVSTRNRIYHLFSESLYKCQSPHIDTYFLEDQHFRFFLKKLRVEELDPLFQLAKATYRGVASELLKPNPRLISLLTKLKSKYKLGVLSDSRSDVARSILLKIGVLGFFDVVVVSEDLGVEKPNQLLFKRVLSELRCSPEEVIYVGDSLEKDIAGGNRAGMKTVWIVPEKSPIFRTVTSGDIKPDFAIKRLSDLTELLKDLT